MRDAAAGLQTGLFLQKVVIRTQRERNNELLKGSNTYPSLHRNILFKEISLAVEAQRPTFLATTLSHLK